ncbi:MAG: hypothetical protein ABMB14_12765 [Myxococcota bacterium]
MSGARAVRVAALGLALAVGCDDGDLASGASEPIRVREGTFHRGPLPVDDDAPSPSIVNAGGVGAIGTQGQASLAYTGIASKDAFSVAVAFPTLGSGFWVVPVGGPDPTQDRNLGFQLTLDLSPEVPYGLQTLSFVAIDGHDAPGPSYDTQLCVLPDVANGNLAACDPAVTPLNAVLSLSWDTDVDLDLVVVTPEGKIVSAKQPATPVATGTIPREVVSDPTTGKLSRDSNANCAIDGIRLESLVFPGEPPAGDYTLYASLRSACGQASTRWSAALHRRVDAEDGTHPVETTALGQGTLLALHADGGASLGTYVTTVSLP